MTTGRIPELYLTTRRLRNWYRLGKLYVGWNPKTNKRIVTEVIYRMAEFSNGRIIEGHNSVYVLLNTEQHPHKRDEEL